MLIFRAFNVRGELEIGWICSLPFGSVGIDAVEFTAGDDSDRLRVWCSTSGLTGRQRLFQVWFNYFVHFNRFVCLAKPGPFAQVLCPFWKFAWWPYAGPGITLLLRHFFSPNFFNDVRTLVLRLRLFPGGVFTAIFCHGWWSQSTRPLYAICCLVHYGWWSQSTRPLYAICCFVSFLHQLFCDFAIFDPLYFAAMFQQLIILFIYVLPITAECFVCEFIITIFLNMPNYVLLQLRESFTSALILSFYVHFERRIIHCARTLSSVIPHRKIAWVAIWIISDGFNFSKRI